MYPCAVSEARSSPLEERVRAGPAELDDEHITDRYPEVNVSCRQLEDAGDTVQVIPLEVWIPFAYSYENDTADEKYHLSIISQ